MQTNAARFPMMTLYSLTGARKYLTASERTRFHDALPVLENPKERSFVEMIYWTGCRPCEALSMRVFQILLDDYFTVIQSAKKRGKQKGNHFRPVPLPVPFTQALDAAHNIRIRQQQGFDTGNADLLWTFSRTKGWRLVNTVMKEAGISGIHACARGLRHTMGTHGAIKQIPQSKMQSWLGHADLSTTAIYMNAIGPEDHAIAARMW